MTMMALRYALLPEYDKKSGEGETMEQVFDQGRNDIGKIAFLRSICKLRQLLYMLNEAKQALD